MRREDKMGRKIISERLTPEQLKRLRAVPFIQRNKIIQNELNRKMRVRVMQLRLEEQKRKSKNFIF